MEANDMKERVKDLANRFIGRHVEDIRNSLPNDPSLVFQVSPGAAASVALACVFMRNEDFEEGYRRYLIAYKQDENGLESINRDGLDSFDSEIFDEVNIEFQGA